MLNNNTLTHYISEIDKISLLTREEESRLAKEMVEGKDYAREQLIKANLRFVVTIAKKYQNDSIPLIDLINEGNMGLIIAASKFDYRKGYHFISYAVWWIKWAILKALLEQSGLIRLPVNRANQLLRIKKYLKDDMYYNEEEIIKKFDIKKNDLNNIITASKDYISIDAPISSDKKEIYLKDIILDTSYKEPYENYVDKDLKTIIKESLKTLSEREEVIIKHRYGIDGYETLSLSEIGKKFNLTKERIRQIEKKAIRRLRHPKRSQKLKEFLK